MERSSLNISMTLPAEDLVPKAVVRKSHRILETIRSILASLVAYIEGKKAIEQFKTDHKIGELKLEDYQNSELSRILSKLVRPGKQIDAEVVIKGLGALEKSAGKPVHLVTQTLFNPSGLAKQSAEEIRDQIAEHLEKIQIEVGDRYIFVPLILGSGSVERQHIVLVSADLKDKRIEYFDSKGVTLKTKDGKLKVNQNATHRLVAGAIAALEQKTHIAKTVQNPVRLQHDIDSCGIHVLQRMTDMVTDDTKLEDYVKIGRRTDSMAQERLAMAKEILDSYATK